MSALLYDSTSCIYMYMCTYSCTCIIIIIHILIPLTICTSIFGRLRGWRNTVETVLLEISNSMKP